MVILGQIGRPLETRVRIGLWGFSGQHIKGFKFFFGFYHKTKIIWVKDTIHYCFDWSPLSYAPIYAMYEMVPFAARRFNCVFLDGTVKFFTK